MNSDVTTTESPGKNRLARHKRGVLSVFEKYLGWVEDVGAVMILLFIVGLIGLAIVMRTAFKFESSAWEEVARFLSLWMYLFGVAVASRENSHLRMSFLEDKIKSEKTKQKLNMIFNFIALLCIVVFAWWSIEYLQWSMMTKQRSLVLMMAMWVTHISFVMGSVLGAFHMLLHFIRSLRIVFDKPESSP